MNDSTDSGTHPEFPHPLRVIPQNVPAELKQIPQWVTWKYEFKEEKWTKRPYQVNGVAHAKSNDAATWGKFEDALKTYQSSGVVDGIGIVLTTEMGIAGIDLDHIFDSTTRKAEKWAIDIVQKINSYSEFSPSGEGVRIFVKGSLPPGRRKKGNIEMYDTRRYFTVTGHRLKGAPETIESRREELNQLHESVFREESKAKTADNGNGAWNPTGDDELLNKAFAASNGDKLKRLFEGDITDYPSQSEADLALCSMLAFWTDDAAQIDRIFRHSGLMREKWDEKHGDRTYGEMTISKAFANRTDHYEYRGNANSTRERNSNQQQSKPKLEPEALYGLAGEIVREIGPHTEAHDVALLTNTLAAFGNVIGPSAYATVQTTEHPGRLFVVQVGATSKGRKDTGWSPIRHLFSLADPDWSKNRIKSGLSSGEGLVYNVRDPVYKQEPIKEKGRVVDYQQVMTDAGEDDKRLLIVEPEFASTLTVMGREGNILSAVIRQSWDDGNLSPLTKNNPIKATGAHITLITFITSQELLSRLDETSKANGFANRFLWALVERSKELPEGAMVPQRIVVSLTEKLSQAVTFARRGGIVKRDEETREAWAQVYGPLSAGRPGLTGAILSRAEAQVLRLSVLYALLDSTLIVRIEHLKAALGLWQYCEASTLAIFGNRLGDPTADRILEALRQAGAEGMTDNDIYELFGRNRSAKERERALAFLENLKLVTRETVQTRGRPRTIWRAT